EPDQRQLRRQQQAVMQQEVPKALALEQPDRRREAGQNEARQQQSGPGPGLLAVVAHLPEQPVQQDAGEKFRQPQQRHAVQQAGVGNAVGLVVNDPQRRQQVDQPERDQPPALVPQAHQARRQQGKAQVEEEQGGDGPQRRVEGQVERI